MVFRNFGPGFGRRHASRPGPCPDLYRPLQFWRRLGRPNQPGFRLHSGPGPGWLSILHLHQWRKQQHGHRLQSVNHWGHHGVEKLRLHYRVHLQRPDPCHRRKPVRRQPRRRNRHERRRNSIQDHPYWNVHSAAQLRRRNRWRLPPVAADSGQRWELLRCGLRSRNRS